MAGEACVFISSGVKRTLLVWASPPVELLLVEASSEVAPFLNPLVHSMWGLSLDSSTNLREGHSRIKSERFHG